MKVHTNNGAVKVAILSPTADVIMIMNPERDDPKWGLPGGTLEDGETVLGAAVREIKDETGLVLEETDIKLVHPESTGFPYCPSLCLAVLDQEHFNRHHRTGDENGDLLLVKAFTLDEALSMTNVLWRHQKFVKELAVAFAAQTV